MGIVKGLKGSAFEQIKKFVDSASN